jgi:hypothetical protein
MQESEPHVHKYIYMGRTSGKKYTSGKFTSNMHIFVSLFGMQLIKDVPGRYIVT